jgi:hypothetical protein
MNTPRKTGAGPVWFRTANLNFASYFEVLKKAKYIAFEIAIVVIFWVGFFHLPRDELEW